MVEQIAIAFGPERKYTLTLPVAETDRADLLQQFQAIVAHLAADPGKKPKHGLLDQQVFSFCK